jgi:hypothetical protein
MTIETKTFEVKYKRFEVGERVKSGSPRCPLAPGQVYVVTRWLGPLTSDDIAIIYVEGRVTGISAEYVVPAEEAVPAP